MSENIGFEGVLKNPVERMLQTRTQCLAILIGLLSVTGAVGSAHAQNDVGARARQETDRRQKFSDLMQFEADHRIKANPEIPASQRMLFDYGALITFQYNSIDDRLGNNHGLRQTDLIGYVRAELDSANEIFARYRASYQDFNPGDSFEGRGSEWNHLDFDRAYYRFDLARYFASTSGQSLAYNVTMKLGRDLVYWANGLVLGQVIDGGLFELSYKKMHLELLGGITPVRTVDFDSSRPNYDHNTRRGFFGGMLKMDVDTENFGRHHPFVYGMVQRDFNSFDSANISGFPTQFNYNSYYIGFGSTGSLNDHLLYGVEAVYQGGDTLSNSFVINGANVSAATQTRNAIQAGAVDIKLDYLVNDSQKTRLSVELLGASGDGNRGHSSNTFNGSKPGKNDHAFNALGLINTGLAFSPQVSNLAMLRLGASTYPLSSQSAFKKFQIGTDLFVYGKMSSRGGFSEPAGNSHYLGIEPDLFVNWQICSDVTLAARYGVFFPGGGGSSAGGNRQFFYLGVTFAF